MSLPASYRAYKQVDIETASQGKLIVLLFNGALQRAEEAKRLMASGSIEDVHKNLVRAQEILGELRGALDMRAGEIAVNLDRSYEYFQHLLVRANIEKDTAPIDECIELMGPMRDTWEEVFSNIYKETPVAEAPKINPHGATVMNVQG